MKRMFTLVLLMAFFAGIAVAQELYEPQFEINVNLTDEYAILVPSCTYEDLSMLLYVDDIEVDIPCVLPRGRADYQIIATVVGLMEDGNVYDSHFDIVIPATAHFVPDVDGDGVASIADVTMLLTIFSIFEECPLTA